MTTTESKKLLQNKNFMDGDKVKLIISSSVNYANVRPNGLDIKVTTIAETFPSSAVTCIDLVEDQV